MTDPKIAEFHQMFADLLKRLDHPEVAQVAVTDTAIRAEFTDGSKVFAKVAHVQPKGAPIPAKPSWPGILQADPSNGGARR